VILLFTLRLSVWCRVLSATSPFQALQRTIIMIPPSTLLHSYSLNTFITLSCMSCFVNFPPQLPLSIFGFIIADVQNFWSRVDHGSIFLDPTQSDPPDLRPDPTRLADPTKPDQLTMTTEVEFSKHSINILRVVKLTISKLL